MKKLGYVAICMILFVGMGLADDVLHFLHGTVEKVDHDTKTVVIKTADGTKHTVKFTGDVTFRGSKDGFDGLKEGSEVVVRTTGKGVKETAVDAGKVSKDGLQATKGTIVKFDKDAKTVVVKSADGTEKTFDLSAKAVEDAGKATGKGVAKGTKVTVYYTDDGGKKVAHYLAS